MKLKKKLIEKRKKNESTWQTSKSCNLDHEITITPYKLNKKTIIKPNFELMSKDEVEKEINYKNDKKIN